MIGLVNNAVAQYGAPAVIAGAFVVGVAAIPLLTRIASVAERILTAVFEWTNEQIFFIRMRSMGCEVCAQTHRSHIEGAHNV